MLRRISLAIGLLLSAASAFAGGPVNPPGPQPTNCTGGNSITGYPGYGQALNCGTALNTGTINAGSSPAIAQYSGLLSTTVGAVTVSGDATLAAGGALTVGSIGGKAVTLGAALTTTGAATPTLAFPASGTPTYTFPGGSQTLASLAGTQTFTGALTFSGSVTGSALSTYLASPPAIGGTAAAAGAFTTLSASSTISGAGFSAYLASPPAIGGTTAAAGNFTTLGATGNLTTNITGLTQCVHANSAGVLSGTGTDCGAGSGGVTSVGLSVPSSSLFAVTGSPVTSSGTLGLTTTGTSGGIPYFSSSSQLNSSAALTANALVLGGGAGTAPAVLGSLGTTTTVLHGNASGDPSFGSIATGDISANAVTYAKIQNETASTLLGNPTGGAAAPSEISLGTGLGFSGTSIVSTNAVRELGTATGLNFNSTADQSITITAPPLSTTYRITEIDVTNCSTSITTAAGGFYTAISKGGTAIVASTQTYSNATSATSIVLPTLTAAALSTRLNNTTIYLSLTTAQGAAATCDVFVFGLGLE